MNELEIAQTRADAMSKGKGPFRIVIAEKDAEPVRLGALSKQLSHDVNDLQPLRKAFWKAF